MLRLALLFLVVALIAGLFAFGGVPALAHDAASILFYVFGVLAVLAFAVNLFRGEKTPQGNSP